MASYEISSCYREVFSYLNNIKESDVTTDDDGDF